MNMLVLFGTISSILILEVAALHSQCKPLPGAINWPSKAQWQELNRTVSGRLRIPYAPGAACHPNLPEYNNASCSAVKASWTESLWQESNAWTSMYNDDTCAPLADAPCSTDGYPAYVVAAETARDVQAAIKFANQTRVRLILKGTGHDVPGRSAGAGSLSIWTHLFRGVDINRKDPVAAENGAVASVRLGAGMTWGDIYTEMAKANLTVVGGADPHVGVGGWTQGAGHGPVSSYYGLGADQVLAMEVVTADGKYRTVNATSSPDLFWALRGGGPSTYAVMLSMTVKAYPKLKGILYSFNYTTSGSSDDFWNIVSEYSAHLPHLSEQGVMGYYYLIPYPNPAVANSTGYITATYILPNKSRKKARTISHAFTKSVKRSSRAHGPIHVASEAAHFSNFMHYWRSTNAPESVGTDTRYGSWLLDAPALTGNKTRLRDTLRDMTPPPFIWVGHLVAGAGVRNAKPAGGSDAVLPAWRRAYVHLLQSRTWPTGNNTAKTVETTAIRDRLQPALRALAPSSGAYVNEADPSNPRWKVDYYGGNYDKLREIKDKWDPEGVFWCKPCVGHDEWDIVPLNATGKDVYERGIGQDLFMLCRESNSSV